MTLQLIDIATLNYFIAIKICSYVDHTYKTSIKSDC